MLLIILISFCSCSKIMSFDYNNPQYINGDGKKEYKDTLIITYSETVKSKDLNKVSTFFNEEFNENVIRMNIENKNNFYCLYIEKKAEKEIIEDIIVDWIKKNHKLIKRDTNNLTALYLFNKKLSKQTTLDSCAISFDLKNSKEGKCLYKINSFNFTVDNKMKSLEELQKIPYRQRKKIVKSIKKTLIDKIKKIESCHPFKVDL